MNDDEKNAIIQELNFKIGSDINELGSTFALESELADKRDKLLSCLTVANNEVPTKLSVAIKNAEVNSMQIQNLKVISNELRKRVAVFLEQTEPLRAEMERKFHAINKLYEIIEYLRSFEKVDDLSRQMKQSSDDEQLVLLYGELKHMCQLYQKGHRGNYVKEYTHYWHNVLKDKLTQHFDEVMKLLKWPFISGAEHSPPPKEVMIKFTNLIRYLFLIEEPEDLNINAAVAQDFGQELNPCLPVRVLLRPLKKRFAFHFMGSRQTARIDRPEWFLTQTLTWIKDHQNFVQNNVQPVADKLELDNVNAVDQFNAGLISLAAERLHSIIALYHTQGTKREVVDADAAFAHAVDEILGFNRELSTLTGKEINSILSVLTKAETFVRWLAVEKKYALSKMDEILGSDQWTEPVVTGTGVATGAILWVPRAADWFVTLLKTIEDRYAVLPQPGHRLQFLELQLELLEEWRIRLTQLLSAAMDSLVPETFLSPGPTSHPLIAVTNTAHHSRIVLLQWANSLHYLQLHYYRRQFQHFTQQQHHEDSSISSSSSDDDDDDDDSSEGHTKKASRADETMSLKEVELRAKKLALNEMIRRDSMIHEQLYDITAPIANLAVTEPLSGDEDMEEAGVFAEAPALLSRLLNAALDAISEHITLEFKASIRDYKKQKWHNLPVVEELALTVSPALCAPLSGLSARLSSVSARLAPCLAVRLRAQLATNVDRCLFEAVVLENWFNTGGTMQFTFDVKRNLVPTFAPPSKVASQMNQLPKLLESCKLLNQDYEDARRLRDMLERKPELARDFLGNQGITSITGMEALQILNQRTDLCDTNSAASVLELF
ncbi:RAD50-interacting protein 1 [Bombyx mandarina]|uniref:RAD50-interacting protein 1 n=1 Tax=Bombyx mandarina TaxID=7092 RepID=A0A6J2KQZ9_BOMMA|nr:RAD50-interacting protein 1 [Bombyx mandarina]